MKKIPTVPVVLLALSLLPLLLFLSITSRTLNKSFQSKVVNDPQTSLAQALSGMASEYDRSSKQLMLDALRLADKDALKKALTFAYPISMATALKPVCEEALKERPLPFLVVIGKDGKVLFDNLDIPKPVPSATPANSAKKAPASSKKAKPTFASASDWPGVERALAGEKGIGIFFFQGGHYLVDLHPVQSHQKVLAVLALGQALSGDYLKSLHTSTLAPIVLYSKDKVLSTFPGTPPSLDFLKRMSTNNEARPGASFPVTFQGQPCWVNGITLLGLDRRPAAFLVAFQESKQDLVVIKDPRAAIRKTGLWLIALTLLPVLALSWIYWVLYRRLALSVETVADVNRTAPFPQVPFLEWTPLAESLERTTARLQEKDRISLILGKVVDPEAARKILSDKDYFSLKGERRECSLLQADLKGFNTLSENMTPEALVEALNQYFSVINEIVFKHEGMLDKFVGGMALAVWGAPFSHDDKEARAVRCALEVQEAVQEFNITRIKKGHPPFTVGIGIHTGTLVAGNLGSNKHYDYSIIGEPLQVVGRLCAMAAPGQTVVSDETYDKVQKWVKAAPLNPLAVKGSMEPLKTYQVTAES